MHCFRNRTAAALAATALAIVVAGSASTQTRPTASRGNLHVLTVGVSQYERPGNDLQWADQDATDHANFWTSQQGRLFDRVFCRKPLLNREATRANILRAMEEMLQSAQPGETLVAAFSGHGVPPQDGEWRFCASDGFITASELRTWVSRLAQKGVRVILIIDACFAGAVDINVDGVAVLTACQANELSFDGNPLALKSNGLFTQVLLEALSGKADVNGDGIVTFQEVADYVSRHVPELAQKLKGQQQPKAFRTFGTAGSMPLCQVTGATPPSVPAIPDPTTGPITTHPGQAIGPITGPSR